MSVVAELSFPEWTEYRKKNGLDPLGMQNSSVHLYQTLIPGIGNVTLRMRYYGLYAWLSWVYAKRIGDTNPKAWQRMIRRTEALYALIAQRRGDEGGVTGTEWAQEKLKDSTSRTIDFAEAAKTRRETSDYYFAVDWGAYGLAYASQLFQIGIFDPSREHAIAMPSLELGEKLAQAFDKEMGELSAPFYEAIQRGKVSLRELDVFARLAPSGIRKGGPERKLYEDILFARTGPQDEEAISRRSSLLLILKVAEQIQRAPTPDDVRWLLYAGKDRKGQLFAPGTKELEAQIERWRIYQANDLCHVALECLLKFILDKLGDYPRGIAPSALIAQCVEDVTSTTGNPPASWNAFVAGLDAVENTGDPSAANSEAALAAAIMTARRVADYCSAEIARSALTLLALLHRRFRQNTQAVTEELKTLDLTAFHSLLTEGRYLDQFGDTPFSDAVARIIEERVIRRHLWVALRKFQRQGDYTFLIEADDGLIWLREKDGPVFTNPRLGPAIRFLRDIHLIDDNGLTRRGVEVLQAS
ncbi:hypothetical protein [Bradyrhizobium sp. DASA03007]|uniref:hypothetical protein n=1 Tax=unclassified Bradyrhizobium TaxID=2631580 RepID=UPI003F702FAC